MNMRKLYVFILIFASFHVCFVWALEEPLSVVVSNMKKPLITSLCYDQNYLISYDGGYISLWNLNSRRLVRSQPCKTNYLGPSPLGTEWVNVSTSKINKLYNKYYALNLITGDFIPLNIKKAPQYSDTYFMNNHPDFIISNSDKGIVISTEDGMVLDTLSSTSKSQCGRLALDSKDSLLLVTGSPSYIFDLKNARLASLIAPEVNNDTTLYWAPGYSRSSGRFIGDDKVMISAHQTGLNTYSLNGTLLESIQTDKLVYSYVENDGLYLAGSYDGIYSGNSKSQKLQLDNRIVEPKGGTKLPNRNVYDLEIIPHTNKYLAGTMFGELYIGDFSNQSFHERIEFPALNPEVYGEYVRYSVEENIWKEAILDIAVSSDNKYTLVSFSGGQILECPIVNGLSSNYYNGHRVFNSARVNACNYLNESTIIAGSSRGDIALWKRGQYQNTHYIPNAHANAITDIILTSDGKKVISASDDGIVNIWDASNMEKIMSIYPIGLQGDYAFVTPDNFYKTSKIGTKAISFVRGVDSYSFEQFDLQYNRPDIILERLGVTDARTKAYHKAWSKRLKRSGLDSLKVYQELEVPRISIPTAIEIEKVTSSPQIHLAYTIYDSKYRINSMKVLLNGALFQDNTTDGILHSMDTRGEEFNLEFGIDLAHGMNHIDVSVTNELGIESLPASLDIYCNAKPSKRTIYIASIGVSEYEQNKYNLNFAEKDAHDFIDVFRRSGVGIYDEIKVLSLCNEEFTSASLAKIEEFFSEAGVNDLQLLFYAGHGVIDSEMDYYLSTFDMDFDSPAMRGISYEKLMKSFSKSPCINRVCFIDACHSGELFKDDYSVTTVPISGKGKLTFRSIGNSIATISRESEKISFLVSDLFVDIRDNEGIIVLASAGSTELAFEGDSWENGLFTWSIKQGMQNGEADLNKDGSIELDELISYVCTNVNHLSNNVQTPVVRTINRFSNPIILK